MTNSQTRDAQKYATIAEVAAAQAKISAGKLEGIPDYVEQAAASASAAASSAEVAVSAELIVRNLSISASESATSAAVSASQAGAAAEAAINRTVRVPDGESLTQLPSSQDRKNSVSTFDSIGNPSVKNLDEFALLDSDGKLPVSNIPSIALTKPFVVSNQSEMLGLDAQIGDIAKRTDLGYSFCLSAMPPSEISNWIQLTDNVLSQLGQKEGASMIGAVDENSSSSTVQMELDARVSIQALSDDSGSGLIGYGNATLLDLANSVFVSDFSSALESRFPSSIKTMTIVKYHADSVGIFNLAHATNIMRRTSETGSPGDTDGGSWLIDANGVKWVTTLPLHVDRFGAFPGKAISSFDSGPAYQKAVKAAGLEGYGQRTTLLTGNYVYTIDSKVLLPSCIEIIGNGTTYVSHNLSDDFKFETAYFKEGVLTSNIPDLTDEQCIASAIVRNTSFVKSQFLGVKRCFNLRCFTMGCEISDVAFHDCGIAINSIQGFYASYNVDVIGDFSSQTGDYAIALGRATNLVSCIANISSRSLGISLSEPYNSSFLQNNTQNVSFEGSSFETMERGITLLGENYTTNANNIYCENVTTVLAKSDGEFKSHSLKVGDGGWMFNVIEMVRMYGLVNAEITISDYGSSIPKVLLVNTDAFKNSATIYLSTQSVFSYPTAEIPIDDNVRYVFNYRVDESTYTGQEVYAVTPIYFDCDCSYEFRAISSNGDNSLLYQGRMTRFNTLSYGSDNSYVSLGESGELIIHFKNLSSTTYPWMSTAKKYISLRS